MKIAEWLLGDEVGPFDPEDEETHFFDELLDHDDESITFSLT